MTTMQAPQSGVIVFTCKEDWGDCQKKQAKAKAEKMNAMCPLTRRKGISKPDGLAASLRDLGNDAARVFKEDFKKIQQGGSPKQRKIMPEGKGPKGDELMHDCMKKDLQTKGPDAVDSWSADHVKDLQFGGKWWGPLEMLDSVVNEELGRQPSHKPNNQIDVATGFTTKNC